jgi:inosose dehydratase
MRIALNPIQWMASDDGWLDPSLAPAPDKLLELVKQSGFDAIMAEVPAGRSIDQYRETVDALGLALTPGYFVCRPNAPEEEVLEKAAVVAKQHASLGVPDIGFGLSMMGKEAPRVLNPARGHDPDPSRLTDVITRLARIADVMRAEGIRPAVHPHVATWIETESESRAVLDALPDVAFLPDTGHLAWAGIDVRALIADYASRVSFVHVKDCRLSVARQGHAEGWDYQKTVVSGLWAEPGRGELPLKEILDALPTPFDGWLMVEVDRPDISDPYDSAVASASWMKANFG